MPQLLLEILSEEIPARMQAKAQADLERALMDRLSAAGIIPEGIKAFSGPRRLVAVVEGLPAKSADVSEDIQGPKEGAPDAAIQGFMKKAGLASIAEAHIHDVPKKGRIYVAHVRKSGKDTAALIAEMVPAIIRDFHWPKSMRWGPNVTNKNGDLRWVRPISRILCTFDGQVVPFEIEGITSDALTEGHRVLGRGPFKVRRFDDYADVLKNKGKVVLDRDERRESILHDARAICAAQNLELVEDIGLLEEVTGLAEHPVVIMGDMDPRFLDLPPEVIKLSMRTHQKYFAVRDPQKTREQGEGQLAPKFIVVANLTAADGGAKIAAGNSRVLSARLNDARFFWDNDRKIKLEDRFEKLGQIVFHEKLGSVKDKAERVMALARELAPLVGADPALAERAAKLAKCDLVSDMVGEFAELEGVMGRYYALLEAGLAEGPLRLAREDARDPPPPASPVEDSAAAGRPPPRSGGGGSRVLHARDGGGDLSTLTEPEARAVADAVRDHYKPKGPGDAAPSDPVSVAVALADKLDTLVGFWAIDEKPTGSKDPFALRRAALGVIRILLGTSPSVSATSRPIHLHQSATDGDKGRGVASTAEGGGGGSPRLRGETEGESVRLGLRTVLRMADVAHAVRGVLAVKGDFARKFRELWEISTDAQASLNIDRLADAFRRESPVRIDDLLAFFADRLKVHLREQGARHDLIDAVFALGEDDLVLIVKRVEALGAFLDTEDGKNLLAGFKRAANILRAEEKKDGKSFSGEAVVMPGDPPEVATLHAALAKAAPAAREAVGQEDFAGAMRALSALRGPVDAFFNKVTVNADDPALRENRLKLLSQIRGSLGAVADFSKIEG